MIHLDNVTIRAGAFELRGISLLVAQGQSGVLMGRTGCGKTTLLEAICGLDDATRDSMIALLKQVQQTTGVTLLHVTHSHDDAARLADCRFTLDGGKLHETQR